MHIEGELRSREFEKNGVTHKTFECRVASFLKMDRAIPQDDGHEAEESPS